MSQKFDAAIAEEDLCPACGAGLDARWACPECGFDAMPVARPALHQLRLLFAARRQAEPTSTTPPDAS